MLYFLCGLSIQADSYYKIPLYTPILNPTNSWSKYRTQYGLINEAGTQVIPPRYDMLGEVSEGFVAYRIGNAPCGYLDVSGRIVIPPIYARCFPFRNGIARVYRFIGDTHPYSCRHEANRSIESILITKKNQPLTDGRKFLLASDTFSEGLMPVMLEGKKCVCFEGHNCDSAKEPLKNVHFDRWGPSGANTFGHVC